MNDSRGVISEKFGRVLIIICCLTYASAYLGRLSYSANITAIAADMGVTKDALGLVGTYMFFAYGAGQLVHFFLAKYYNPKPAVPLAAVGTAVCNYLMTVATDVSVMKIIWMINGICQSFFLVQCLQYAGAVSVPQSDRKVRYVAGLFVLLRHLCRLRDIGGVRRYQLAYFVLYLFRDHRGGGGGMGDNVGRHRSRKAD